MEVELLPPAASDEVDLMERVTELTNDVYAVAETGLWVEGATRTTADEAISLTRQGEIAVARLEGQVVGAARIQKLDDRTGEVGMLSADRARRGIGIGRELLRFAEEMCRANGMTSMQLELLVPREWSHPTKEFLADWYSRAGYRIVHTGTIDEAYPELAPLLATPCDFVIYRKPLDKEEM